MRVQENVVGMRYHISVRRNLCPEKKKLAKAVCIYDAIVVIDEFAAFGRHPFPFSGAFRQSWGVCFPKPDKLSVRRSGDIGAVTDRLSFFKFRLCSFGIGPERQRLAESALLETSGRKASSRGVLVLNEVAR